MYPGGSRSLCIQEIDLNSGGLELMYPGGSRSLCIQEVDLFISWI